MPDGEDPGDLAGSSEGRERLRQAVDEAVPFLKYRIERALGSESLDTPEGRTRAAEKAMALVGEHPNVLYRDQYLMEVASLTRMDPDRLRPMLVRRPVANRFVDDGFDYEDGYAVRDNEPEQRTLVVDRREAELVRMLIHRPDELGGRVCRHLFAASGTLRAFEVVSSGDDWIHRLDEEPEQVAGLLRRLAVDEVDEESDPLEELGWVVGDTAGRIMRDVKSAAVVDMSRYRELQPLVQWTKLRTEELVDATARVAAIDALLAWLHGYLATEGGTDGRDARAS